MFYTLKKSFVSVSIFTFYKSIKSLYIFLISHKPKVCIVKVNINLSKTNQARNHRC